MKKPKNKISRKEKRRLKFLKEQREQRIKAKNLGFSFPKKQDIRFKDPKGKK